MFKKVFLLICCLSLGIVLTAYAEMIPISKTGEYASVPLQKPVSNVTDNSNRTTLLTEDFTSTIFPPTGWTRRQTNTGTQGGYSCYWDRFTGPTGIFHSAPASAGLWWSYNHQDEWLISPSITLTGSSGGVYYLKWWFYGYCGSTYSDHYYTKIITATDTVMVYDLTTQTGGWLYYVAPVELSLNAYAGQTIKVAFQAKDPPTNDGCWYAWAVDDIEVGYPAANDVGVDAILAPGTSSSVNVPITPNGSIKNYGSAAQTNFQVVCSIVGAGSAFRYTNTQTVTSLAAGATTTINFTPWTPTTQEILTVMMKTTLAGDENPANDRKTSTCTIGNWFLQEGFNGTFPPTGWVATPIVGTYNWTSATTGTNPTCSPYEGAAMVTYNSYSASTGNSARLASPAIALGSSTVGCTLSFYMYHDPGYSSSADKVGVEYSTNGTAFTQVAEFLRYSATEAWTEHKVFLGNFSGTIYLGFLATSAYGNNLFMDYVTVYGGQGTPPPQKDVGVDAIVVPGAIHQAGNSMLPIARIKNYGVASQSGFAVVCSMVGTGGAVRYTNTKTAGSLAPNDTARINFDQWIPTIGENLTVVMRTNLAQDSNPANDRKTRTTLVSSYLLMEGFNDATFPPTGWDTLRISGTSANNTWTRQTAGTYPTCTPIEGAGMARYYAFLATAGNASRLFSPPINLGSTAQLCSLKFYMTHDPGYASNDDNIKVQYSTNGTDYIDVATFSRYASAFAWTEHAVYIGSLSGTIRVGFLATSAYGNNMFIDDIRLKGGSLGVEEEKPNRLPSTTILNAPKPNPVTNGLARISFNIAEPTKASLKIYDASGKLVKTLLNTNLTTGIYNLTWNGTDDKSNTVAEGIYFYTLETANHNFTKKLVFTR